MTERVLRSYRVYFGLMSGRRVADSALLVVEGAFFGFCEALGRLLYDIFLEA